MRLQEFEGRVIDANEAIEQAQISHKQGLIDAFSSLLQVMDEKGITHASRAQIQQCLEMARKTQ